MNSKKIVLVIIVILIGMFCLPKLSGLAEEGSAPNELCTDSYNVFFDMEMDEITQVMGCGLESDDEGNTFYVIDAQVTERNEVFLDGLKKSFGEFPFANFDEMKVLLEEEGSLSFEMVDDAGVVTTVKFLDEYMEDIQLKRLINDVYAEYVDFYQDNLNIEVLSIGGLDILLNGSYELANSMLMVHLLDSMTWDNSEWLERSLVFEMGDDFELIKEVIFSNEVQVKYAGYLRTNLVTKKSFESTKNNLLAGGYFSEEEVLYKLRDMGLGQVTDRDWIRFSLTNGIVLDFIFDEEKKQIEILESFDRVDIPIASLGLIEGIESGGPTLEGMSELKGSKYDPFSDFTELEFFTGRIIYQAKGTIEYSSMFRFPTDNSNWDKVDEIQAEIFDEWVSGKPEREKYLFSIDQLNSSNGMLAIDAMIIDNRSVFLDLLDKSFNEDLFMFGENVDFNDRAVFLSQILSYNDLVFYSFEQSQKIFFLGDNYDSVKNYFLSDEYYLLLKERNVDSYKIIEKGVENPEVSFLRFYLDGIELSISFYDEGKQISVQQVIEVLSMDFDD